MKRYFFFALFYPPAFMNLLLLQAQPDSFVHYFLSGYVVSIVPALLTALADEFLERRNLCVRAAGCMLVGFLSAPVALASHSMQVVQLAVFGAIVSFICFAAYHRLTRSKLLVLPPPEHFKPADQG